MPQKKPTGSTSKIAQNQSKENLTKQRPERIKPFGTRAAEQNQALISETTYGKTLWRLR
jgi:hypothetical protein